MTECMLNHAVVCLAIDSYSSFLFIDFNDYVECVTFLTEFIAQRQNGSCWCVSCVCFSNFRMPWTGLSLQKHFTVI